MKVFILFFFYKISRLVATMSVSFLAHDKWDYGHFVNGKESFN
ncbi:protein of unknown function [Shewanella benthica]|uniref:Uncharacterized protein n=1 Tax=Shewanella benthica TaxID=43661 RepID=A0A330M161_9GAMM|nr:protein of unknown function [Shewanella benthica]